MSIGCCYRLKQKIATGVSCKPRYNEISREERRKLLDDLDDLIKKNNEEVGDENSNIFEEHADLLYEFDGRWFKWNDYEFKEAPDINGNLNRYVCPIIEEGTWQDISMYRVQPQSERYRPVTVSYTNLTLPTNREV